MTKHDMESSQNVPVSTANVHRHRPNVPNRLNHTKKGEWFLHGKKKPKNELQKNLRDEDKATARI
jgi:hypothetical protein